MKKSSTSRRVLQGLGTPQWLNRCATWALLVVSASQLTSCGYYMATADQAPIPPMGDDDSALSLSIRGKVNLDDDTLADILALDPSAKPLKGWAIRLTSVLGSPTVYTDTSVLVAFTDDDGYFTIQGVPDDSYRVIAVPPADFVPALDSELDTDGVNDGSVLGYLSLSDTPYLTFDFTKKVPSTTLAPDCDPSCFRISGVVYMNKSGDAQLALDGADGLLEGAVVELYYGPWASRTEGSRVLDGDGYPVRAVTDANGRYEFQVAADSYKVVVAPELTNVQFNWESTSDGRLDGATNVLVSSADVENVNFGILHNADLEDRATVVYDPNTTLDPGTTADPGTTPAVTTTPYATTTPHATTPAPTTVPPTTPEPTTAAPTTPAPTTAAPTTPAPTTAAPTTPAPTTPAPTTPAPTTPAPTTPHPTTPEPTTSYYAGTTPEPTTSYYAGTTSDPYATTTYDPYGTTSDPYATTTYDPYGTTPWPTTTSY